MATDTLTHRSLLNILACANCGMLFAITDEFERRRRDDGQTFYCPAGHQNVYRDSEIDKLRRERDRLKRQAEWAETSRKAAQDQAETAEYRRRAAQGQLTKIRKRVAAGVCPCCTRSFANLREHMEDKHPGFKADETSGAPAETVSASSSEIRAWARRKRIRISDRGRIPASVRERYQREHATR